MEKLLNNFKICFTKGDTYALAVKVKGIVMDLNSAYFTVKENPDDSPLIQKTLGAGISKIDERVYKKEKTYKIQLQSEDTANLEPLVQYLYDFRIAIGNVVKTVLSGVFVVNHNVSEISTLTTSTLDVSVDSTIESELSNTPTTSGIEYEQDPVACGKIGDMTKLNTTAKDSIVKAINETAAKNANTQEQVTKILNGTTTVPNSSTATTATNATYAQYASEDTSKGTIEERLSAMGFSEGSVTKSPLWQSPTRNVLYKQGKFVYGRFTATASFSGNKGFYGESPVFTIPNGYLIGATAKNRLGNDGYFPCALEVYKSSSGESLGYTVGWIKINDDGKAQIVDWKYKEPYSGTLETIGAIDVIFGYQTD